MWNSILVILLAIGGSLAMSAFECDTTKCDDSTFFKIAGTIPTAEELRTICGPAFEQFACRKKAIKSCTGKDLEELASSDNATVAHISTLLLRAAGVFKDVCDEDSLLHYGYASSAGCFNEMMKKFDSKCEDEAVAVYHAYKGVENLLDKDEKPVVGEEGKCFVTAYAFACFTVEVQEKCGEIARATLVEVLKRMQLMSFSSEACNEEQLAELRTDFLGFTELDEQKKTWFMEVYNTRK